jgi:hypothetical protein
MQVAEAVIDPVCPAAELFEVLKQVCYERRLCVCVT